MQIPSKCIPPNYMTERIEVDYRIGPRKIPEPLTIFFENHKIISVVQIHKYTIYPNCQKLKYLCFLCRTARLLLPVHKPQKLIGPKMQAKTCGHPCRGDCNVILITTVTTPLSSGTTMTYWQLQLLHPLRQGLSDLNNSKINIE